MRASRYGESNGSGGTDGVNSLRPMAGRCQDDPMNHGIARGCACVPRPSRRCSPEPGAELSAALLASIGEGRRSDTGTSSWRSRRWHRHRGVGTRFEDAKVSQLAASAVPAHGDVDSGHAQHQLLRGFLLRRFSLLQLSKQRTASGELPASAAIGEQPVMAQAGEPSGQHMQEEAANELVDLPAA